MSVRVETVDEVLVITLARPEKRNAIDEETTRLLESALDRLEEDRTLRAAVLSATGPIFSAGTDLRALPEPTSRGGEYGVVRRPRTKPLIAAVEGPALGGGFELVLACDLVVASHRTTFSLPESRRGMVATSGALFRAAQRLPANVTLEMLIAGLQLEAPRAYDLGFVNRLTEDGRALEEALDLARAVCLAGPAAVRITLEMQREILAGVDVLGWAATERAKGAVLARRRCVKGSARSSSDATRTGQRPSCARQLRADAR